MGVQSFGLRQTIFYPAYSPCLDALKKEEYAFRPLVEKEVEDGQVSQETVFLLVDLVVASWLEVGVRCRVLGTDRSTVVNDRGGSVGLGEGDAWLDVEKFAHLLADLLVEIKQERIAFIKEGADVILVVFKEGRLAIGRLQGIPMQTAPMAMIAQTDVLDQ